jgi:hypothetical protein
VFKSYEVVPMHELGEHCEECKPERADFWGLYGIDEQGNAFAIGDFSTKYDAEFIKDALIAS